MRLAFFFTCDNVKANILDVELTIFNLKKLINFILIKKKYFLSFLSKEIHYLLKKKKSYFIILKMNLISIFFIISFKLKQVNLLF